MNFLRTKIKLAKKCFFAFQEAGGVWGFEPASLASLWRLQALKVFERFDLEYAVRFVVMAWTHNLSPVDPTAPGRPVARSPGRCYRYYIID